MLPERKFADFAHFWKVGGNRGRLSASSPRSVISLRVHAEYASHSAVLCSSQSSNFVCKKKATKTGFSHCTKMVSVKPHNDFSRPLVDKRVVWFNRNHFCEMRTHSFHNASTCDRFCDRLFVFQETRRDSCLFSLLLSTDLLVWFVSREIVAISDRLKHMKFTLISVWGPRTPTFVQPKKNSKLQKDRDHSTLSTPREYRAYLFRSSDERHVCVSEEDEHFGPTASHSTPPPAEQMVVPMTPNCCLAKAACDMRLEPILLCSLAQDRNWLQTKSIWTKTSW